MNLRSFSLCAAIIAAACSDNETTGTGGSGGGAPGPGAGGSGGGTECPAGSHEGPPGSCVSSLVGWAEAPPLAQARDHHAGFVVETDAGAFLFAAGGVEDNMTLFDDIEVAAIGADGTLGAWAAATPLPERIAGAAVAVVDDVVVIAGGYRVAGTQPSLSRSTEVSRVAPDGTLGAWTEGPDMAVTRFHGSMVASGRDLYVVGGLTGNNTVNTERVERATVGADGTLGPWADTTPLPRPLSHHSVAVHDGAVYVTGGLEGNPNAAGSYEVFADVLRAPIQEDGSLGAWTHVGTMPHTLSTHASFVHLGQLYVIGGIEDDVHNTDAVWRAPIADDGTVGPWEAQPPVPSARAHAHQAPVWGGFVYAVAGATNHVSSDRVFIGRFE